MDSYTIILPNEKISTYKLVTFIVSIMNSSALFYLLLVGGFSGIHYSLLVFSFLISVTLLVFYLFLKSQRKTILKFIIISILFSGIIWLLVTVSLICLGLILFSVFGLYNLRPFELVINKDGVVFPSFPKKHFRWEEIDQIVLKDFVLTIDLKNNKLMQYSLNEKENISLNELSFNQFVKSLKNRI